MKVRTLQTLCVLLAWLGTCTLVAGVEEDRIDRAARVMPDVASRYRQVIEAAADVRTADQAATLGSDLWTHAVDDVQSGHPDDRSLYWTRLAVRAALDDPDHLNAFERTSRGFDDLDVRYPGSSRGKPPLRVLVTGFDPFLLDRDITQSNPSGLAALALDGTSVTGSGRTAGIESVVFPVRFQDFDDGIVEALLEPHLRSGSFDLILTISMGRSDFDLERFPGRRRSAEVPDNRNVLTGASGADPLVPLLDGMPLAGPEFVEFSLPADAMSAATGNWAVRDNRTVTTLERGELEAASLAELAGLTAVRGSGGGYLSNEISYRSVRLRNQLGSATLIGHLHTPALRGHDAVVEADVLAQIREILAAAIGSLQTGPDSSAARM